MRRNSKNSTAWRKTNHLADAMKSASDPATEIHDAAEAMAAAATGPEQPVAQSKWYHWRKSGTALIAYLLDSEVHTFAFSVAANAIISFIPFVVLLYTLALSVFHSEAMKDVVNDMVNYFLPSATKASKDWLTTTIVKEAVLPTVEASRRAGFFAGDDSDCVHRHFSAFGGGSQSSMGSDQEPQLPLQPDHRLRAGAADAGARRGRA